MNAKGKAKAAIIPAAGRERARRRRNIRVAAKTIARAGGDARRERNCSVARTLDIVSDAWAFLIIREAFFGTQTFEAFRSALGIPRATLADRLKKLTDHIRRANEDAEQVRVTSQKISRRFASLERADVDADAEEREAAQIGRA